MAKISGYLKDGAGQAVAECAIILTALKTNNQVIEQVESCTTTKEGFYEINGSTGQYTVTLSIAGHPPKKVGVITIYSDSPNGTLNDFLTARIDNNEVTPLFLSQLIEERKQAQQAAQSAQKSAEQASSTLANVVKNSGDTMSGQLLIANGDSSALRLKNKKGDEIMLSQDADCNFVFSKYDTATSTWENKLRFLNSTNSWRFENVDDVIVNNKSVLKVGDGGLLSKAPILAAGTDLLTDAVLSVNQTFTLSSVYINSPDDSLAFTGSLIVTRRYYDSGAAATLEINHAGNVFYKATAYKSNGVWKTYGWVEQITTANVARYIIESYVSTDKLSWYQKWSDGLIEQGGYVEATATAGQITTNFITPFLSGGTGQIQVFKQIGYTGSYTASTFSMIYVQAFNITKTQFSHYLYTKTGGGSCTWYARGY